MKTPMQEFIEVLKTHHKTANDKMQSGGAHNEAYYEGRREAFWDAISFAELHLEENHNKLTPEIRSKNE